MPNQRIEVVSDLDVDGFRAGGLPASELGDVYEDITLSDADRQVAKELIAGGLPESLPEVLFNGGIPPVKTLESPPNQAAVLERCAAVAVERSVALMIPTSVHVLKVRYANAPDEVLSAPQLARELGKSVPNASTKMSLANKYLLDYAGQVIDGSVDYEAWGRTATVARRNVLMYMTSVGLDIPRLASMDDLRLEAMDHLESMPTVSQKEKQLVAALFHLDGSNVQDIGELGEMFGYYPQAATIAAKRALGRITTQSPSMRYEKNGGRGDLPPLPADDPVSALALIRMALRSRRMGARGGNGELSRTYIAILEQRLAADGAHDEIISQLGEDEYQRAIQKAYRLTMRYCKRSHSPLAGHIERDEGIVKAYLADVVELHKAGLYEYVDLAAYIGIGDVSKLYAANPDLPKYCINRVVNNSRYGPEAGLVTYRRNLADATARFGSHPYASPSQIRDFCAEHPQNYVEKIEGFIACIDRAAEHFSNEVIVTTGTIRYFAIKSPANVIGEVQAWLDRREALLKQFPISKDLSRAFLGEIARRKPSSARPEDGLPDTYIDSLVGLVQTYKENLKAARAEYGRNPNIDAWALRWIMRRYLKDPQKGIDGYFATLRSLKEEFAADSLVDDDVMKYHARQYIGKGQRHAGDKVRAWKGRYARLDARYKDNPLVDEAIVRQVALRWYNDPDNGVEILLAQRRRKQRSIHAPLAGPGSDSTTTFEHFLSDETYDPAALVDQETDRQGFQEAIMQHIACLSDAEQTAVFLVYGLHDMVDEDVNIAKLARILGTDNLADYVEDVIMPKIHQGLARAA